MIGLLLAQLYLDSHPYQDLIDPRPIKLRYSLCQEPLRIILDSSEKLHKLNCLILETSFKDHLITLFEKAVLSYNALHEDAPVTEADLIHTPSLQKEILDLLNAEDKTELLNIYQIAQNGLIDAMYAELDEKLALFLASYSDNILDRFTPDSPEIVKRLNLLKGLTHKDPALRPSLKRMMSQFFYL